MYNIGIDLGGTNVKVGIVDNSFNIVARSSVKTNLPKTGEEIADTIVEAVKLACEEGKITTKDINSIGIGTPGAAQRTTGMVLFSNNLGFKDFPLGVILEKKLGMPVYLENDANAAAYGESLNGAAKGCKNVIVITLGTGVGGGVIIDGKILTGYNFCGAELGHTVIVYDGVPCSCGRKGCFESYASASALIRETKEAMEKNPTSKLWEKAGGNLENVDGKTAFDGMRALDPVATHIVDTYIKMLGCGLTNMINIFQPEMLLIGGGVCKEGDTLINPLKEIISKECYCAPKGKETKIGIASLGNDAGIIGAACLYMQGNN